MVENLDEGSYDAFVCHEFHTAHNYAIHLKNSFKNKKNIFVAPEDIPKGVDERNYRYSVIKNSPKFIIIMTTAGLESIEVKNEIKKAISYGRKKILIYLDCYVNTKKFKETFPGLGKKQRGMPTPFYDKFELANVVRSWFDSEDLYEKEEDINLFDEINEVNNADISIKENKKSYQKVMGLKVIPRWSIEKLTKDNKLGHIIFEIENLSGKPIIIHGYRMFRINPDGEKDVYYHQKICDFHQMKHWYTDPHVKTILWNRDKHEFHWRDVDIIETYGINKIGKWGTEVWIAYMEAGKETLSYSIGETYIEFE